MYIFHNYNLKRKFFQGSSMTDEGLVSVFAIGDVSNNLAAVDWISHLSGLGNWERMKQIRQNCALCLQMTLYHYFKIIPMSWLDHQIHILQYTQQSCSPSRTTDL
jgi:hypothetical protein